MFGKAIGLCRICVAAAVLIAAPQAFAGKKDDTLNIAWGTSLPSYDAYFDDQHEEQILLYLIWDTLIDRDPATGNYRPLLAKSYRWIDPQTMEFVIRDGIKFHNGDTFSADDVVYTLNYIADPANHVFPQPLYNWISKAEKVGDDKVVLHFSRANPAAEAYLATHIPIYPKAYYQRVGSRGMSDKPVGTGPYRVTAAVTGQSITLERNPDYFEASPKGKPAIGRIVQRTIPDAQTAVTELLTGRIDWLDRVSSDIAGRLEANRRFRVSRTPVARINWIDLDTAGRSGKNPFQDTRVRQALGYAIDREAIAKTLNPGSIVLKAPCASSMFGCAQDIPQHGFDPAKAKELLVQAGYPDGFESDFYAYTDRSIVEAVAQNLRDVGIKLHLIYLPLETILQKEAQGTMPLVYLSNSGFGVPDASIILNQYFTGGPQDFTRDQEIIDWVKQAGLTSDPAQRQPILEKAITKIAAEAYWVPMTSGVVNFAYSDAVDFEPYNDEVAHLYLTRWR